MRRLSVSAPKMKISSKLPWQIRFATYGFITILLLLLGAFLYELSTGFSGATPISWRSELNAQKQAYSDLEKKYTEILKLSQTSQSELLLEKAAQESFKARLKEIEADNANLKEDLAQLQLLLPSDNRNTVSIHRITADVIDQKIHCQVLMLYSGNRNKTAFTGQLRLELVGTSGGKTTTITLPGKNSDASFQLNFKNYFRWEGSLDLLTSIKVTHVVAKIYDNKKLVAQNSYQL